MDPPAATPSELAALAADPRAGMRRRAASDPRTPPEVLARLAEDGNLWVRSDAALNPATPRAALDRLIRAGSAPGLAGPAPPDPSLAPAELAALAEGGEWARRLAARHPATPPEALALLAADPIPAIRAAAAMHPAAHAEACSQEAAGDGAPTEARAPRGAGTGEAMDTAYPAALLERLAEEAARDGRDLPLGPALALAADPGCPAATLERLAEHGAGAVRATVAAHAGYGGPRRDLLRRAGSTADLQGFAPPDPTLPAADLARLARGGGWARLVAARHPATAPEDLARLAADADPLVRREALVHPSCPAEVRELLEKAGGGTGADLLGSDGGRVGADETLSTSELERLAKLGPWGERLAGLDPESFKKLL